MGGESNPKVSREETNLFVPKKPAMMEKLFLNEILFLFFRYLLSFSFSNDPPHAGCYPISQNILFEFT